MRVGSSRNYKLLPWFFDAPLSLITMRLCTTTPRRGMLERMFSECDKKEFYAYSAQRWLWNEPAQLLRRYVRFNLNALIRIAEEAAGHCAVCVNITKLPEGNFNKVFLATIQDGKQLIVKIPNPNAGRAHYTTASEVATMQFVREKLHIPVPKVISYCSRASESKLGAEYIVMEKAPGVELGQILDNLKARDKLAIVKQIAAITCTLARSRFPCHGALYRRQDVMASESIVFDQEFALGPTVGRAWFDDRRGEVDVPRGPWTSTDALMKAIAQREAACVKKFPTFPRDRQQGIFDGPGGYHPTKEAKLSVLEDFLQVLPHITPRNVEFSAGVIWHNDLHASNIFVDTKDPSQITSIIDWQGIPVYPLFLVSHHPSLLEYEGPKLDGFVQPTLPEDFESLNPEAKRAAKDLFLSQSLWLSYEIEVQRAVPELLHTFRQRETLPGQIMGTIGSIYNDGEPYVQSLLADLAEEHVWRQVVGVDENGNPNALCPLKKYSDQDMAKQRTEYARWRKDVERKTKVLDEIGVYTGWDGAVSTRDYDEAVRRLAAAKQSFLARESTNEWEKAVWEKAWPFQDH